MKKINFVEVYKCVILGIIAVAIIGLYLRPVPKLVTIRDIRDKQATAEDIPIVEVRGSVSVDGYVTVDGSVSLEDQPIQVEIVP